MSKKHPGPKRLVDIWAAEMPEWLKNPTPGPKYRARPEKRHPTPFKNLPTFNQIYQKVQWKLSLPDFYRYNELIGLVEYELLRVGIEDFQVHPEDLARILRIPMKSLKEKLVKAGVEVRDDPESFLDDENR